MKVLIFSVAVGGGHANAADAIKSYMNKIKPDSEVKVIDVLKYINPMIDKVVIGSYLNTIKLTPSLFGKLYYHAESDYGISSFSTKCIKLLTSKLLPLIQEFQPNIIVCTHPFPTEMVSIMKTKYNVAIPVVTILTDYSPHSFWMHPCIDAYVVSNDDMIDEMSKRGVQKDIIHPLGIPVKPGFCIKYDKEQTFRELELSGDKTTILIMGGSLGIGKITNVYEELIKIEDDIQIIVITGKNKKLYAELMKLKESSPKPTRIIGYTDKVNKYMQASDLLLTKPGGLTITEALISNLPLGLFSPIPGHEEENSQFLLKHKLAVDLGNSKNCKDILEDIISSPKELQEMKENCLKFAKPNSGPDICNLLINIVKTGKVRTNESGNEKYYLKDQDSKILKSIEKLLIGN
jgi:processive 1,2-diacylglycerol beta-glucosyltransferase